MTCKNCIKSIKGTKAFCSQKCRNFWVSDLMVKKSIKIKKTVGNSYYTKKDNEEIPL